MKGGQQAFWTAQSLLSLLAIQKDAVERALDLEGLVPKLGTEVGGEGLNQL
jgi:hypothetical protein